MIRPMHYTGWVRFRELTSGAIAVVAEDGYCIDIISADHDIIDELLSRSDEGNKP